MPARGVDVEWEVAADEGFSHRRRGMATAAPEAAHSVHVELTGLEPAPTTSTDSGSAARSRRPAAPAPRPHRSVAPLTMWSPRARLRAGLLHRLRRLAEEEPDLVVHLGDYLYEYAARGKGVSQHVGPETVTLANYRQRYAQYKTDPDLQAAHAAAPWLAVFDDHEVANNWADEVPAKPEPAFLVDAPPHCRRTTRTCRCAGCGAAWHRHAALPAGEWGGLATFHMLDTRQYRTTSRAATSPPTAPNGSTPHASLTGAEQERWLSTGFSNPRPDGTCWGSRCSSPSSS